MSGMELNKISAAVLTAGIIALVTGIVSQSLYKGSEHAEHGKQESKRGYTIAGADLPTEGGTSVPADTGPVNIAPYLAKADIKAGEAQVKKCTSCHTFDKGGKDGVGPNQWGLVGSAFAHKAGYAYSPALAAMKDKKWGFQELSDFLVAPSKYVPGTKMSFAGIKKPEDRANLIAYLNTLGDTPLPLPK